VSIVDGAAVLLPHLAGLHLDRVYLKGVRVRIEASTSTVVAPCPDCGVVSMRVHSRYARHLVDAGIGGREVTLTLTVRRLFCDQPYCARKTFAEQVPGLTTRYGRRTAPAAGVVESVAMALGGRAGARLADRLALPTSRMTLLRVIRRVPDPATPTPQVLGVDLSRCWDYSDVVMGRGERPWGGGLRIRGDGQPVGIITGFPGIGEGCRGACSGLVWCSVVWCGPGRVL
jgi:hypothetical protein